MRLVGLRVGLSLLLGAALALALPGCNTFPDGPFSCSRNDQCVRGSNAGSCQAGFCAFPDGTCRSGLRYDSTAGTNFADQCVTAPGDRDSGVTPGTDAGPPRDAGGDTTNGCGGRTALPGVPGTACGPCGAGVYDCETLESLVCNMKLGLELDITSEGTVSASSTYSGSYPARLSVDGDRSTSWFSAGVEPMATVFTWENTRDDCITRIALDGNATHDNRSFRTNFGFGQVTVQVLDADDTIIASIIEDMPGTPDPPITVMPTANGFDGALGRKVRLLFTGHESTDCGGFSELNVGARR